MNTTCKKSWPLGHHITTAVYLLLYWSLGLEFCFRVTLPFLLNSQQEVTIVAVVLFICCSIIGFLLN